MPVQKIESHVETIRSAEESIRHPAPGESHENAEGRLIQAVAAVPREELATVYRKVTEQDAAANQKSMIEMKGGYLELTPAFPSKYGKSPNGSTVTENSDGTLRVADLQHEGKKYAVDFPDQMRAFGELPRITDENGQEISYLTPEGQITPLASAIEGRALDDKSKFDALQTLEQLHFSEKEKLQHRELLRSLENRSDISLAMRLLNELAQIYDANQAKRIFQGLVAAATLADSARDWHYGIYEQGLKGIDPGTGIFAWGKDDNGPGGHRVEIRFSPAKQKLKS